MSPPLVCRKWLLELLRREQCDENEHRGDDWVRGWNARARSLVELLEKENG